jgi:uncharacterized protein
MKAQYRKTVVLTRKRVISILKNELPLLKERYGVEKIVLYGSFAKGYPKKKSDIDILVDLRRNLGFDFIELADRLEEILGRKVDVATFDHFKQSFGNPRYKHIAEDIKQSMIYV